MSLSARRLVILLSFIVTANAFATTNVFGPKSYAVTNGKPQVIDDVFAVDLSDNCDGRAVFVLTVENSGVSSAIVTLNGATLLSESDFPGLAVREIIVGALPSNHIAVTIKGGKSDGSLRLTLQRRIEESLVGPKTLIVSHGPAVDTASFIAEAGGVYTLALRNDGVSNANVLINGNPVVAPSDFSAGVASLARRLPTLAGANEIRMSASGSDGATLLWTVYHELDESVCGPHVTIDAPAGGETVTTRRILVTGTATGSRELGVAVNGQPAAVDTTASGTKADPLHWAVSIDALHGPVVLNAVATNAAGGKGTDTRAITYAPAAETVLIRPVPDSGATPLHVNFDFSNSVVGDVAKYEFDLAGDGTYEISSTTRPENLTSDFTVPGTATIRARVTMTDGRVFNSTAIVTVQSFATADQTIRAAWSLFFGTMAAGDANGALAQLANDEIRAKYRSALQALGSSLPAFAAAVQDIRPIWIRGNLAHYLLVKTEQGSPYGYHVYFGRGTDGLWHVMQF